MPSFLQEGVPLEALIWLLPIAFFIHDGEEIATVERWVRKHKDHPRIASVRPLLNLNKNMTVQFAVAVLLLGSIISCVTYFAAGNYRVNGTMNTLYCGLLAVFLLDGIKHVGLYFMLKTYTPGVITAAFVEIPFAGYALYRFFDHGMIHGSTIAIGLVIALPLTLLAVWASLTLGRMLAPSRGER
ncbi:HXXEE domain-containing protein [Paenibacillus sp. DMB20]|uniref:HXXEE domain-containing protein n=1 Tax=Paenibacillus sp. DMB20 TaxID=1642570 RepID=UPI00069C23AC|nr:HXXEE domain-containing protein [Paenibacillus sp. DMB20]